MTNELATIDAEVRVLSIEPVSDNRTALARYKALQDFVGSVMVKGEDYGTIPGTGKPTLYKPGAEKLAEMYGLAITLPADRRREVEDWEKGFWHYEVTCQVVSRRTGEVIAEGVGSCNSMEEKYRWRKEWWNGRGDPPSGEGWQKLFIKRQNRWSWFRNNENEARWDLPNTILKMAKKRAVIDAILSTTRSSGIFTQDVEDMSPKLLERDPPEDEFETRPVQRNAPAPPPAAAAALVCVECGVALEETRFRDGTVWAPEQLAGYGRRKHDRVLCLEHYRRANEARRRAEELGDGPVSGEVIPPLKQAGQVGSSSSTTFVEPKQEPDPLTADRVARERLTKALQAQLDDAARVGYQVEELNLAELSNAELAGVINALTKKIAAYKASIGADLTDEEAQS